MSYATLTLSILFFLNLFVFLAGQPYANAPMLALVKVYVTGNVLDLTHYLNWGTLWTAGAVVAVVAASVAGLSGTGNITGNTFGGVHALTVISICLVFSLFAIPNFSYMGLPATLDFILTSFLSFMIALSVVGMFKGE